MDFPLISDLSRTTSEIEKMYAAVRMDEEVFAGRDYNKMLIIKWCIFTAQILIFRFRMKIPTLKMFQINVYLLEYPTTRVQNRHFQFSTSTATKRQCRRLVAAAWAFRMRLLGLPRWYTRRTKAHQNSNKVGHLHGTNSFDFRSRMKYQRWKCFPCGYTSSNILLPGSKIAIFSASLALRPS
jgi:hypothetical protein